MSNKDIDLEYCPVCGHSLSILETEDGKFIVTCYYCDFEDGPFDTYEQALKRWERQVNKEQK